MAAAPPQSGSRKRRVLFKVLLSVSIVTILAGSYWQQQLLKGVDTVGSSMVAQWEAGLPKHSLHNIQASFLGMDTFQTKLLNETDRIKPETDSISIIPEPAAKKAQTDVGSSGANNKASSSQQSETINTLPQGFQSVLKRSMASRDFCKTLKPTNKALQSHTVTVGNVTAAVADLPDFGIVEALFNYTESSTPKCHVPPPTECNETMFTVIFMGYNPDRLHQLKRQVFGMTQPHSRSPHVKEVILVWNGPRELTETDNGVQLEKLSHERNLRIFYPLKEGFPNDLMNRYHPRLNVTTKAILFYDDDGPFYSFDAIMGGFELWKRNSNAQIGAMARRLDVVETRQQHEAASLPPFDDHAFLQHCRASGDSIFYNYYEFANYHARMVLPSGSFLHANYLCFLWHPALEPIREFVRAHPVHPDDVTVSTIVSHVAGRAPMVYSRRINPKAKETNRRRLLQKQEYSYPRRRLLWEDVSQQEWATMRSMAVNSLVSYFGGINSGSLGWCHGTEYQKKDKKGKSICDPLMANVGMLPWMTPDHKPKDTCP